jgi:hypothetical protein
MILNKWSILRDVQFFSDIPAKAGIRGFSNERAGFFFCGNYKELTNSTASIFPVISRNQESVFATNFCFP